VPPQLTFSTLGDAPGNSRAAKPSMTIWAGVENPQLRPANLSDKSECLRAVIRYLKIRQFLQDRNRN
jgi:hypothetical protein